MKKFLTQMFSDVDGQVSFKRFGTLIVILLIASIAIGVTYFKANFQSNIWDDLVYTFWLSMAYITSEKFTKRSMRNETTTTA